MTYDYQLTDNDMDLSLLTAEESAALDKYGRGTQEYLYAALLRVVPRMDVKEWMDRQSPLQVRLSGDDLYSALLTMDEAKNLRKDFDVFLQKWDKKVYMPLLKNGTDEARKAMYLVDCAAQVYYRHILATTSSRAVSFDTRGERILSPEEYLDRLAHCSDADEKRELKSSITRQALCATLQGPKKVMVDYMLAPFLERLRIAGYVTGQSCSGLLADHPNYRYVSDDERGRFVKGECINFNKQGSGAYITFWKPEADDVDTYRDVNSRGQMEDIRRMARQNGWTVEDTETFYLPSVKLMLPYTYDGSAKSQLSREASARVKEMYPKLWDEDFDEFMNKKSAVLDELADRHGGVVRWTDMMIVGQWEKLVSSLELACRQRRETENAEAVGRISDVTVYMGGDGYYRIKCSIDGESRMSERLSDIELAAISKGECPEAVAARVYSSVLAESKEEQSKGMKR